MKNSGKNNLGISNFNKFIKKKAGLKKPAFFLRKARYIFF